MESAKDGWCIIHTVIQRMTSLVGLVGGLVICLGYPRTVSHPRPILLHPETQAQALRVSRCDGAFDGDRGVPIRATG